MYSRFVFVENTIGNLPKVPRANFLGSDELFCFISICKFGSFKNAFEKPCTKTKRVIDRGKRSKTLNEVKPIENISKNLQSFLKIRPVQKEVLPLHKLGDHAYEY